MYNVLLQSDSRTIQSLCQSNKIANTICHDKHFWMDKFSQEHLEALLLEPTTNYLNLYKEGEKSKELGKNILKINEIEKNRDYNNTLGVFKVLVEDKWEMVSYLFEDQLKHIDKENVQDIQFITFILVKNQYQVTLVYYDHIEIDLGTYSYEQVEQLLGPLLYKNNFVRDNYNYHMIYNGEVYNNNARRANPNNYIILMIRRGMWEIINS